MFMQLYQIRLLTLLNRDQGTKYFTIRTVLRDVWKSQNVMAKYYRCLRSADKDDDFYKALLRVDEDMVSHLHGFFQCSCVLQEPEGLRCCKKHVTEEGVDIRVAYTVRRL